MLVSIQTLQDLHVLHALQVCTGKELTYLANVVTEVNIRNLAQRQRARYAVRAITKIKLAKNFASHAMQECFQMKVGRLLAFPVRADTSS